MSLRTTTTPGIWFTMGPSSADERTITDLFREGATGVRLTFSYGTPQIQIERADTVRKCAEVAGAPCFIVADLAGEKIRLGEFGALTALKVFEGQKVGLSSTQEFSEQHKRLPVNSRRIIDGVKVGDTLVIGDGSVTLEVRHISHDFIESMVSKGGTINPNRGIAIQSDKFAPSSLTTKDVSDLRSVLDSGKFHAVALSFVSSQEEILRVRKVMNDVKVSLPIIAKIETKGGLDNLHSIAKSADTIMIARGDLALYLPWPKLGKIVEELVAAIKEEKKPWIIATQLVEGLERFSFPTRAEICDMTHWIQAGVSAFLLSYETAFGTRPADAIGSVRKIIEANS